MLNSSFSVLIVNYFWLRDTVGIQLAVHSLTRLVFYVPEG